MSTFSLMVSATIVAMLLTVAVEIAERTGARRRALPARAVWVSAGLLAVAVFTSWAFSNSDAEQDLIRSNSPTFQMEQPSGSDAFRPATTVTDRTGATGSFSELWRAVSNARVPTLAPPAERALAMLWLASSLSLLGALLFGARRLTRERRTWTRQRIADENVLVSPAFGPGLVGFRRPEIVVPRWLTELEPDAQRAVVLHEDEHRAAGDHILLVGATALLVAMPWNVGMWMLWRRLRRAVEFDCDARVVKRGVDKEQYATTLLNAWGRAHGRLLSVPAFAERASGLGARVHHLLRPAPQEGQMRKVFGVLATTGVVAVACMTPRPKQTAAVQSQSATAPLVVIDDIVRADVPSLGKISPEGVITDVTDSVARFYPPPSEMSRIEVLKSSAGTAAFGDKGRNGVLKIYTKKFDNDHGIKATAKMPGAAPIEGVARAAGPDTPPEVIEQNIYDGLFKGVQVATAARPKAMTIIHQAREQEVALYGAPILAIWPRIVTIKDMQAAQLRQLLTSASDRAQFDANAAAHRPRGGPTLENVASNAVDFGVMMSIKLSDADRERALAIVRQAEFDATTTYQQDPMNSAAVRERQARRDSALFDLLTNDADRATFRKNQAASRRSFGVSQ